MVTFLEGGLLKPFDTFFVFLLVLVAGYAILKKIKIFGDNDFVNVVVSFVLAALFAMSTTASKTIAYATPWIVFLLVVAIFIIVLFKFLGAEDKDIPLFPKDNTTMAAILIGFIIIIFLIAAGQVRQEQKAAANATSSENQVLSFPAKIGATLSNPAVLGLIMVLFIAVFAVMLLAVAPTK
jgi:hypothetical protein